MTKYWFKPKRYGYGFVPTSWEGWLMTLVLVGLIFASAYTNNFFELEASEEYLSTKDGLRFLLDVLLLSGMFTYLSEKKTKGELKWRWGKDS